MNYLARLCPEVAGSEIEKLVCLFLHTFSVRIIGVCKALPRVKAPFFNGAASILNQYLCGVFSFLFACCLLNHFTCSLDKLVDKDFFYLFS